MHGAKDTSFVDGLVRENYKLNRGKTREVEMGRQVKSVSQRSL